MTIEKPKIEDSRDLMFKDADEKTKSVVNMIARAYIRAGGHEIRTIYAHAELLIYTIIYGNGYTIQGSIIERADEWRKRNKIDIDLDIYLTIFAITTGLIEEYKQHQFYYVINKYRRSTKNLDSRDPCKIYLINFTNVWKNYLFQTKQILSIEVCLSQNQN